MAEPWCLHLSRSEYMDRWGELMGFFQDVELEVIRRAMRYAL